MLDRLDELERRCDEIEKRHVKTIEEQREEGELLRMSHKGCEIAIDGYDDVVYKLRLALIEEAARADRLERLVNEKLTPLLHGVLAGFDPVEYRLIALGDELKKARAEAAAAKDDIQIAFRQLNDEQEERAKLERDLIEARKLAEQERLVRDTVIADLRDAQRWRPISEPPTDAPHTVFVLGYNPAYGIRTAQYTADDIGTEIGPWGYVGTTKPTHWMPMPQGPAA